MNFHGLLLLFLHKYNIKKGLSFVLQEQKINLWETLFLKDKFYVPKAKHLTFI